MPSHLTPETKETIIGLIRSQMPGLLAIYLYGSQASKEVREDSDIDIAVFGNACFDPVLLWECRQNLAIKLGRDIDLIDFRAATTVMKLQVLTNGYRLFGSEEQISEYESLVFSDYARLNEERAAIIADVKQRGSVYG